MRLSLVDLLVPPCCVACRAPGNWPLCGACRRTLPFIAGERCPRCALPLPCGRRCPAARSAFSASWAPFAHEGPARELVVTLKYHGGRALAQALAASMVAGAPVGLLAPGSALVPVPCDPARRRQRGFNQARALAEALAARSQLPVHDVLRRRGGGAAKVGAGRAQRLAGSGSVVLAGHTAPARCVLVDDVHTTGATLDECARVLLAGGAQEVAAITATRTLGRTSGVR